MKQNEVIKPNEESTEKSAPELHQICAIMCTYIHLV